MAHQRKTIRDQVITYLTGLTTTGSNIFNSRVYPNEQSKLPLLMYRIAFTLNQHFKQIPIKSVGAVPPKTLLAHSNVFIFLN